MNTKDVIEQKCWSFIKELNSVSEERLKCQALVDGKRKYNYRQMFRMWDRYAEVFSALGITGANHSRAGMIGSASSETVCAFYALNMTGTSVSMVHRSGIRSIEKWKQVVEKERITDLILNDVMVDARIVRKIMKARPEMGLKHVIILQIPVIWDSVKPSEFVKHRENDEELRKLPGVLFMDELLKKYEDFPIAYSSKQDNAAVIIHTSGTTSGVPTPVPLSDRGLNEAVARLLRDGCFDSMMGKMRTINANDMMFSYCMVDGIHLPLAFGGSIESLPTDFLGPGMMRAFLEKEVNVIFAAGEAFDIMTRMPVPIDFSDLKYVFLGGSYVSPSSKKKYKEFLKKCGSDAKLYVGYGLSEAGAACILAPTEREDDIIGFPLPGINIKIYSEEDDKYYDIKDGARRGVMLINSDSVSSGRIDRKKIFDLETIDGKKYFNTNDLVDVNEDGSLSYVGRANKFFVNNEGIRFDAGLVETAVSREPGIEACGLAPEFYKLIHDTVPVMYVQTEGKGKKAVDDVRRALRHVFIRSGAFKDTNLPAQCVITDDLPFNAGGKVDVHRIMKGDVTGKRFIIEPVMKDDRLIDLRMKRAETADFRNNMGVPDELKEDTKEHLSSVGVNALGGDTGLVLGIMDAISELSKW